MGKSDNAPLAQKVQPMTTDIYSLALESRLTDDFDRVLDALELCPPSDARKRGIQRVFSALTLLDTCQETGCEEQRKCLHQTLDYALAESRRYLALAKEAK